MVQGLVLFSNVELLCTPGDFYASMHVRSCDLRRGGGDREAGLHSRLLYRHCRVMCSGSCKPNMIICSCAFDVLVLSHQWTFVPVTSTCILSILCILICVLFIWNIEHLCQIDCFAAFILSMDIETSLCSLWSAWSFCAWWVYERAETGAGLETRWTREPDTRLALWKPTSTLWHYTVAW